MIDQIFEQVSIFTLLTYFSTKGQTQAKKMRYQLFSISLRQSYHCIEHIALFPVEQIQNFIGESSLQDRTAEIGSEINLILSPISCFMALNKAVLCYNTQTLFFFIVYFNV